MTLRLLSDLRPLNTSYFETIEDLKTSEDFEILETNKDLKSIEDLKTIEDLEDTDAFVIYMTM